MLTFFRNFLKQLGWYEYLRYSGLFKLYTRLLKRRVLKEHQREVNFYQSFLPKNNAIIFDIGAYDGHKTAAFLEMANKVICCEPDQKNFRTLQIRFRNHHSRVTIENKAVSDHPGTETYYIHHAGSAFNTLNPAWKEILESDHQKRWNEEIQFSSQTPVTLTTLDELISKYGTPSFIKIDVEGYELPVLKGLSTKVPFISFECLLPDCKTELLGCLHQLHSIDPNVTFNIALDEKLQFPQFLSYTDTLSWVNDKASPDCFEIVAKYA